jgi:hypothetical protein
VAFGMAAADDMGGSASGSIGERQGREQSAASASPTIFSLSATYDNGDHHLRVYSPTDASRWLEDVAQEYRRLRTQSLIKPVALEMDGIEIVSVEGVERLLADALIPMPRGGNFDVVRSDLGEVVLGLLCETDYGSRYGYRSIRDREIVDLPGRGIDQIGVEVTYEDDGKGGKKVALLTLVLGEAKVSSDSRHPPGVVEARRDGLRAQHLDHLTNINATANKVLRASQACTDAETVQLLRFASELFRRGVKTKFQIVCASVMLRPTSIFDETDFGSFRSQVEDFHPAYIRFLIVKVPHTDFYEMAQEFAHLARSPVSESEDAR